MAADSAVALYSARLMVYAMVFRSAITQILRGLFPWIIRTTAPHCLFRGCSSQVREHSCISCGSRFFGSICILAWPVRLCSWCL